jgi:hypothetical protein
MNNIGNKLVEFGALLTDSAILESVSKLGARLTQREKCIDELVQAIATNPASKQVLGNVETVKSYVETLLNIVGINGKELSKTVEGKNRFQYFKRTVIQNVCVALGLTTETDDVFSLADYLNKVVSKLAKEKVEQSVIDAIKAIIPANDGESID